MSAKSDVKVKINFSPYVTIEVLVFPIVSAGNKNKKVSISFLYSSGTTIFPKFEIVVVIFFRVEKYDICEEDSSQASLKLEFASYMMMTVDAVDNLDEMSYDSFDYIVTSAAELFGPTIGG